MDAYCSFVLRRSGSTIPFAVSELAPNTCVTSSNAVRLGHLPTCTFSIGDLVHLRGHQLDCAVMRGDVWKECVGCEIVGRCESGDANQGRHPPNTRCAQPALLRDARVRLGPNRSIL